MGKISESRDDLWSLFFSNHKLTPSLAHHPSSAWSSPQQERSTKEETPRKERLARTLMGSSG